MRTRKACLCGGALLLAALLASMAPAAQAESAPPTARPDKLVPVALDQVKVGGEFGRRMRVTLENSLLNLDVDKLFLQPFREKKTKNGYTGLGMLIDCSARLALQTGDPRVLELKRHMVGGRACIPVLAAIDR